MNTFLFEELTIWGEPSAGESDIEREPHTVNVEVDMIMTYAGRPATGPSYSCGGEPAEGPEFEVMEVRIINPSMRPVKLTETQFCILFPDGNDIINNGYEWASEQDPGDE